MGIFTYWRARGVIIRLNLLILLFTIIVLGPSLSAAGSGSWTSFDFQGSKVHLYRPKASKEVNKNLKRTHKHALMVNLHGCAQKGSTLVEHGNWEEAANRHKSYILIPEVPGGGVYAGCWDYYGLRHQRRDRHNHFLLKLIDHVKGLYAINEHQVYLSGLSSGGGLALVHACLAPEVFAGVGLNAAPSVGTEASDITNAQISINEIKRNCLKLSGNKRAHLQTQVASIIYGDNDFIVDPDYNQLNAKALAELYGANHEESFSLKNLRGTSLKGKGTLYKKEKQVLVSLIENEGLGHNWPAGSGGVPGSFVNKKSIDYPSYLLNFLISNNRRP